MDKKVPKASDPQAGAFDSGPTGECPVPLKVPL